MKPKEFLVVLVGGGGGGGGGGSEGGTCTQSIIIIWVSLYNGCKQLKAAAQHTANGSLLYY